MTVAPTPSVAKTAKIHHLFLDGTSVTLNSDSDIFLLTATKHLQLRFGSRGVLIESGLNVFTDLVAEWHEIVFDEEYDYQGGLLRLGTGIRGVDRVTQLAGWYGETYSVNAAIDYATRDVLVELFDELRITELTEGVILEGARASLDELRIREHGGNLDQPIRLGTAESPVASGLLDIMLLTNDVARGLPAWQGASVRGGELFLEPEHNEVRTALLFVTPTAVARFSPAAPDIDDAHIELVSSITIDWNTSWLATSISPRLSSRSF